jgi:hypothetical protein
MPDLSPLVGSKQTRRWYRSTSAIDPIADLAFFGRLRGIAEHTTPTPKSAGPTKVARWKRRISYSVNIALCAIHAVPLSTHTETFITFQLKQVATAIAWRWADFPGGGP